MSWKNTLIPPDSTIRDAVNTINDGGFEIGLMVDEEKKLLGTVTDGDVRRGLLDGLSMEAPAEKIINPEPHVASSEKDQKNLLDQMNTEVLRQIPLLDDERHVVGLAHIRDLTPAIGTRDNKVVLMAGGLGERLRPLTENTPKPLLKVDNKPLLQSILENFIDQDFRRFDFSVNYRADAIRSHFGDGSKWNVEINYLEEDERLGTAGALRLMQETPESPFIVMNGDLITRINFQDLLDYHKQQTSKATMCVREYDFQVPFGVVGIESNRIKSIDEKPVHRFFVNAGIYVLDPEITDMIPKDGSCDMTQLFDWIIDAGLTTSAFPIHEYWLDVGRMDDLNQANLDAETVLKS